MAEPVRQQLRCYIASPLGFTEAGRRYYREVFLPSLARVVEPVDPWSLLSEGEAETPRREGSDEQCAREIGRRNSEAIRSAALIAAYLDGPDVDGGTAAEIGYAAALGIPCFGLRTDLRPAGEFGTLVSVQVEAFILESGGMIATTLEDLVVALGAITEKPRGTE
jgi:nucleoside 2-deoxyribosyltransferase